MNDMISFNVIYDRSGDTLYISNRHDPATRAYADDNGIYWRYDGAGQLIGATILDYKDYWSAHRVVLERQLSAKFDVPITQMRVVLNRVPA